MLLVVTEKANAFSYILIAFISILTRMIVIYRFLSEICRQIQFDGSPGLNNLIESAMLLAFVI